MSYAEVEAGSVVRAMCDGPGCIKSALVEGRDESDVPNGWNRMGIGFGYRIFHDLSCANSWLRALSIEERNGSGWTIHYTADTIGFPP